MVRGISFSPFPEGQCTNCGSLCSADCARLIACHRSQRWFGVLEYTKNIVTAPGAYAELLTPSDTIVSTSARAAWCPRKQRKKERHAALGTCGVVIPCGFLISMAWYVQGRERQRGDRKIAVSDTRPCLCADIDLIAGTPTPLPGVVSFSFFSFCRTIKSQSLALCTRLCNVHLVVVMLYKNVKAHSETMQKLLREIFQNRYRRFIMCVYVVEPFLSRV